MNDSRTKILFGALLAAVAIAVAVFFFNSKPPKAAPSGPGYYSGPMRNKSNPNIYGTDDGKQVPAPPGDTQVTPGGKPGAKGKDL